MSQPYWDGYIYDKTVFRLLGDAAHVCSKIVLIYTIHKYKSAEGISFLTQMLYLNVFIFRYIDLLNPLFGGPAGSSYNTTLKILYITTSLYTLYLMLKKYPRSREGEREWIVSAWIYVISVIGGLLGLWIVHWQFKDVRFGWGFEEVLRSISLAMEALNLLPQLSLLSSISTPTAITSYYLLLLGSYRALYILNWIQRWYVEGWKDPVAAFWGLVQTYVYLEFAWVYWRRQKIKLRAAGGVLDSEDWVNSGLILRLIFGHSSPGAKRSTGGNWRDWARDRLGRGRGGGGGVSVTADDEPDLFHNTSGYADEDDRDLEGGTQRNRGRGASRNEGTEDEGRVLFGSDSDDDDEGATAWQSARPLDAEEGVVLQDSDEEGEGGMTANEINDRRTS